MSKRESDGYGAFANVLDDVKAYEEASRPPPVVPKTYEWKANFKGIVTLANSNDVCELFCVLLKNETIYTP